jgi:hypothetical protein
MKIKRNKGVEVILQRSLYRDCPILIRRIGDRFFEWMACVKNEFYTSYLLMNPKKGTNELEDAEVRDVTTVLYSGALASIDTLLDEKKEEDKAPTELPS